ncbi:MAG: cytochrome c oxidase subunit II [Planctomycetota bacterium]
MAFALALSVAWAGPALPQEAEPAANPTAAQKNAAQGTLSQPYSDTDDGGGFLGLLPEQASTYAWEVDAVFYFILAVSVFFFVLIGGMLFWFAYKYKQKSRDDLPHGVSHNTPLELAWSALPGVFLIAFFGFGFVGYMDMARDPGPTAYPVTAHAYQWGWQFEYPNGYRDSNLHIPAGRPVRITNQSKDVLHSLYVPAFRAKKDVVPGRLNKMWFQSNFNDVTAKEFVHAPKPGEPEFTYRFNEYDLFCTEYCGEKHSNMNAKVYVHTRESFDEWLRVSSDWLSTTPPVQVGERVWSSRCNSCHSIDGSDGTGPTWKDLYGQPNHMMTTGPLPGPVDAEYLRESTYQPQAKVVAGYPANGMAAWPLTDREMLGVIEYMKTISVHYQGPTLDKIEDWDTLLPPESPESLESPESPDAPEAIGGEPAAAE